MYKHVGKRGWEEEEEEEESNIHVHNVQVHISPGVQSRELIQKALHHPSTLPPVPHNHSYMSSAGKPNKHSKELHKTTSRDRKRSLPALRFQDIRKGSEGMSKSRLTTRRGSDGLSKVQSTGIGSKEMVDGQFHDGMPIGDYQPSTLSPVTSPFTPPHSDSTDSISSGEEEMRERKTRCDLRSVSEGDMQKRVTREISLRQRPLSEDEEEEKRTLRKLSLVDGNNLQT